MEFCTTVHTVCFGEATLTVRGLHVSSIRGEIEPGARLLLVAELDNARDQNAVRVDTESGVFVGQVSWEQARHVRSILCLRETCQVDADACFVRKQTESVRSRSGATYDAECVVASIRLSCPSEKIGDAQTLIQSAIGSNGGTIGYRAVEISERSPSPDQKSKRQKLDSANSWLDGKKAK